VALAGAFFGESMFHRADLGGGNASKACLAALIARLKEGGYTLLDVQMVTPATQPFGAVEISRQDYLERLARAMRADARW
jgi:leucyl/phenylalanyl-tRNA--protein transferase